MKRFSTKENLTFANALVNNHLPDAIPTSGYVENFAETSNVQFGFFDSASPDYSTYYPDLKPEDLEINSEDFYSPVVRALSKIILNKYGPIDFSEGDILKTSKGLLERQSLYANHEVLVGNEIGSIKEAVWQEAFTDKQGNQIPAGINVRLLIDQKSNPRLVRGMKMDPPSIHSFSVGVTFDWEKSHPKMEDNDFWNMLGSYGSDKQLIRRIVTEVSAYHELSVVPHGADPYAQIISEKGINNADYAQRQHAFKHKKKDKYEYNDEKIFSFSANDFQKQGHFHDYRTSLSLSKEDNTIQENFNLNSNNTNSKMNELQTFLDSISQIEGLELSEGADQSAVQAAVQAAVTNLATAQASITSLTEERDNARTELAEANQTLETQKPIVERFNSIVDATKTEATRLYKLAKGDDASTEMLEMIGKAETYDQAKVFLDQFQKDADEKFSADSRQSSADESGSDLSDDSDSQSENTFDNNEDVFSEMEKSGAKGSVRLRDEFSQNK